MSIFDLTALTPAQREITERAINLCDFPWERLLPGLQAQQRKSKIPVVWEDLTRWGAAAQQAFAQLKTPGGHRDSPHSHDSEMVHWHVQINGDKGHVLAGHLKGRHAALGLAWYSGKISIEQSLVSNPDLAIEVFLAEGAHMVDFFYMTPAIRQEIFDAFHRTPEHEDTAPHGHGWFEETGDQNYWSWVGESFMAGFMMGYAPGAPMPLFLRQRWEHRADLEIGKQIRRLLTPELWYPEWPSPRPPQFVGIPKRKIFHRPVCPTMIVSNRERPLTTEEVSQRRPCRICRPVA